MNLRKATLVVKGLILTVAVAAATVGLAAPAWAGQNVSAQIDFGAFQTDVYGAFHHEGDWVQLVDSCDNKAISLIRVRGPFSWTGGTKTYYVAQPGESHRCGTRWINRNFREGERIGIQVCNVAAGLDSCTSWRWGIA
jgi:hypothetical protein